MIVQTAADGQPHFVMTMDQHTAYAQNLAKHFGNDQFEPVAGFFPPYPTTATFVAIGRIASRPSRRSRATGRSRPGLPSSHSHFASRCFQPAVQAQLGESSADAGDSPIDGVPVATQTSCDLTNGKPVAERLADLAFQIGELR